MRPLIGISCTVGRVGEGGKAPFLPKELHSLDEAYTLAVERAGGLPVILPSCRDTSLLPEIADRLDGILFSGGTDLDPALYGQRILRGVGPVVPRRDAAELALARYALKKKMPVLGICRGIQLLNTAEGGNLIQDLPSAGKDVHGLDMFPRNHPSHAVRVEEDSLLARILRETELRTNSFHHQAVLTPAPGWRAVAHAVTDGVIEAIERSDGSFALGVQWHPEGMDDSERQQALFRALTAAAREYRGA